MKSAKHIAEASAIGGDSWELIHFMDLPDNASRENQVEALKADKAWLLRHTGDVFNRLDKLIAEIEGVTL